MKGASYVSQSARRSPASAAPQPRAIQKARQGFTQSRHSSDPTAIRAWAAHWIDSLVRLSDLTITPQLPVRIDHWTDQLEKFARYKLSETGTLAAAQFIIARAQGFESWPKLAQAPRSPRPRQFSRPSLRTRRRRHRHRRHRHSRTIAARNPGLIRAHSTRRHQATLLHYVSANGVEGYRQKTPNNIVPIADLLLKSGADVNAIADIYGGSQRSTWSRPASIPSAPACRTALLQLLLDHGATVDPPNSPRTAPQRSASPTAASRPPNFSHPRGATWISKPPPASAAST